MGVEVEVEEMEWEGRERVVMDIGDGKGREGQARTNLSAF
jgi:hypothetical protein